MAFGIGTNNCAANAGVLRGTQTEIACECWFTSTGKATPLMIKFQDETEKIHMINKIRILSTEEKNYSGIASVEYDCNIAYEGIESAVKIVFFKDQCRWVMLGRQ